MLKPITPNATVTVIYPADPAIDLEKSNLEEYNKNVLENPGCWSEHLKFKDGQRPTEFRIGVVPSAELCTIEDETGGKLTSRSLQWRTFLLAVRDITNISPRPEMVGDKVDPKWLSENFVGSLRDVGLFIGAVAWTWNKLSDADIKN